MDRENSGDKGLTYPVVQNGQGRFGRPSPPDSNPLLLEITGVTVGEMAPYAPRSDRKATVFNIFLMRPRSGVI